MAAFRVLPQVTDRNRHFWQGGEHGELRFLTCNQCGQLQHPPQPICHACHSKDLSPKAVSGRATLLTYTVNHHPWIPGMEVPFVLAIVEIEEQPDVRLTTNIVNCAIEDVMIGMPVQVLFEHHDDVWLPLFEPRTVTNVGGGR